MWQWQSKIYFRVFTPDCVKLLTCTQEEHFELKAIYSLLHIMPEYFGIYITLTSDFVLCFHTKFRVIVSQILFATKLDLREPYFMHTHV